MCKGNKQHIHNINNKHETIKATTNIDIRYAIDSPRRIDHAQAAAVRELRLHYYTRAGSKSDSQTDRRASTITYLQVSNEPAGRFGKEA